MSTDKQAEMPDHAVAKTSCEYLLTRPAVRTLGVLQVTNLARAYLSLLAERERLKKLLRMNLGTLRAQVDRFEHMGMAHYELDSAIKETLAALQPKD